MIIGTPVAVIDLTEEDLGSLDVQRMEATVCNDPECDDCEQGDIPAVAYEINMVTLVGCPVHDQQAQMNRFTLRMDAPVFASLAASMVGALSKYDPTLWAQALDFDEANGRIEIEHFLMRPDGTVQPVEEEDPDAG